MKTFNVALLSDDNTMKMSYFFMTKAENEEEAIGLAQSKLRGIIIDQYGNCEEGDLELIKSIEREVLDFTPEIFELMKI